MLIVRAGVKFALTVQPEQNYAAINGNGVMINHMYVYEGKVPAEWLDVIHKVLMCDHDVGSSGWGHDGYDTIVKGVYSLSFHDWVATQLVPGVDPTFKCRNLPSRGARARAIRDELAEWVAKEPRPAVEHAKRQRAA